MQNFINQILNLYEQVTYTPNAIVSKTLYKTEHAILTLFALAEGQSIAEHITPFDAMVQVLDGEVELTIGNTKKTLVKGESIIMPANVPHALYAKSSYKMFLIMMK